MKKFGIRKRDYLDLPEDREEVKAGIRREIESLVVLVAKLSPKEFNDCTHRAHQTVPFTFPFPSLVLFG